MLRMPLEAEQADLPPALDDGPELLQLGLGACRAEVRAVDPPQLVVAPGPGGEAALGRRAEPTQVQVADASGLGARRELALGEARPPRGRDRPHVDQEVHAR